MGDLPPLVQPEPMRSGRLVEVMPEWRFPTRDLYLVHLSNRNMPRPIRLFTELVARMAPTLFKIFRHKRHKRLADGVYGRKLHPYMLQSGTEAANWIRQQGSQTWPRARDTINLSPFARKIFSAPSSSRGHLAAPQKANFFGVLPVRCARSVTTNIPRRSIGCAMIIIISILRSQATPRLTGQRAIALMMI